MNQSLENAIDRRPQRPLEHIKRAERRIRRKKNKGRLKRLLASIIKS